MFGSISKHLNAITYVLIVLGVKVAVPVTGSTTYPPGAEAPKGFARLLVPHQTAGSAAVFNGV